MGKYSAVALAAVLTSTLVAAYPSSVPKATIHSRADDIDEVYDYIIVGGGTAGLTVGDRLSESGKCKSLTL